MSTIANIYDYLVTRSQRDGLSDVRAACKQFLKTGARAGIIPTKRQAIPRQWLLAAYGRQKGKCARCGNDVPFDEATGDHRTPLIEGGKHERLNIQMMDRACNSTKGARLPMAESKATGRTVLEQLR
jgi:5-methylcytosine-specific restriction endonuclease McrA